MLLRLSCVLVGLVVCLVSDAFAQTPEEGKYYHVRSAESGLYLEATGNGDLCETLSEVLVSDFENSTTISRQATWFVYDYSSSVGGWWVFDQIGVGIEYHYNKVTYISYGYTEIPYCTPLRRVTDFVKVDDTAVYIVATEYVNATCLSHTGPESNFTFWADCFDPTLSQKWIFEETLLNED